MNVVPVTFELNATLLAASLQIVCGEAEPTGLGLTVTSTVKVEPMQPAALGVTVYLTTPAVVPVLVNVCAIEVPQEEVQAACPVIVPPVGVV